MQASDGRSSGGRWRRLTVSISSRPSKMLPDTPGAAVSVRVANSLLTRLHLSARGYHRVLKLSRTIADLAGADAIGASHVAEALQYRPRIDE